MDDDSLDRKRRIQNTKPILKKGSVTYLYYYSTKILLYNEIKRIS